MKSELQTSIPGAAALYGEGQALQCAIRAIVRLIDPAAFAREFDEELNIAVGLMLGQPIPDVAIDVCRQVAATISATAQDEGAHDGSPPEG